MAVRIFRKTALLLLAGALCGVLPALAQHTDSPKRILNGTRFGAWSVSCEALAVNETLCVLNQRLVRSSDGAFLAELVSFNNSREPGAFLAARVPLGVHFPSGFSLRPTEGADVMELTWQSCSKELCEALIGLDGTKVETLGKSDRAVAGYRPRFGAQALVFRIDMTGLDEGLKALASAMDGATKDVEAKKAEPEETKANGDASQ